MRILQLLALTAFFGCFSALADTIELKTGERIEGTFKQANMASAVIEVGGQSITVPLEKVRAIFFGASVRMAASPPPFQEAMDTLRALRTVTQSGISYRDYAPRVLDAKVKIDRYLSAPTNDTAELRKAIETAMHAYELSSQAWGSQISSSASNFEPIGRSIVEDPEISKCPAIKQMIDNVDRGLSKRSLPRAALIGINVGVQPGLLFGCGSAQVAEAERLGGQH
jgi:hypothetical protein